MPLEYSYNFSFTASSLRLKEMVSVAESMKKNENMDYTNDLGRGKVATGKRMYIEFKKRISFLTEEQIDLLINGDLITQKQIAFLSVCKSHLFIRDFVVEVLREKLLVFDYEISEGDYISFYRRKFDVHPEMSKLSEISEKKVRQVIFKILEQAGIIDSIKTKIIQPQIIDSKTIEVITQDDSNWLKVLLMSDSNIENTIN